MKKMKLNTFEDKLWEKTRGMVILSAVYGFLTSLFIMCALLYAYFIMSYLWPYVFTVHIPTKGVIAIVAGIPVLTALAVAYRERRDARRLTIKIQEHYPQLRDRLLTLVEISGNRRQIDHDPFSRIFAKSLEADMSALIERFNFGGAFSPKRLLLPAGFLAACLIAGSVHAMINPEFFTIGFGRLTQPVGFAPEPMRGAEGFVIQVVPGDTEIPRGSNLLIQVTTPGHNFKQGELYFKNDGENAWRIHPGKSVSRDTFQVLLSHINTPGVYRVKVDDQQSPIFQVRLHESLRLERVHWTLQFPDYMKLKEHNRQGWSGKVAVPRGTKVHVEFSFNQPVKKGWLKQKDEKLFAAEVKSANVLESNFLADKDFTLTPEVESADGGMKWEAPTVWIQTLPDLAPYLEILEPQIQNYVFPTQEIPFEINANDDYGIRSVTLVIRYKGREERIEWLPPGKTTDTVVLKPVLKLEQLKLHSRDLVFAYVEVRDTFPGESADHAVRSQLLSFLIRDYVEQFKIRSPLSEKPSLRQLFEEVLAEQEKIMSDTWDYITMPPKDQPLGWEVDPHEERGASNE